MSQLTLRAAEAFDTLIDESKLVTDRACSEKMAEIDLRESWSRGSVNTKRRGVTALTLEDIEVLAAFFGVPTDFFFMTRNQRRIWLGENKWCAPWELNPQPAGHRSVPVQGSFFDDDWDTGGSSAPHTVIDLRDRVMALAS